LTRGQKALDDLLAWSGTSEIDLYPYVRELFVDLFGYPKDHIRLAERGTLGKIPDLSLSAADVKPKQGVFWVVAEIKKERKAFRSADYRKKEWDDQLRKYVSADTVYALLIDPETLVVLRPDGTEIKTVALDAHKADELISPAADWSLAFLLYKDSVCENSLQSFKVGLSPSRYLDVTNEDDRKKLYDSLRVSARELIDFSLERLQLLQQQYAEYLAEVTSLREKVGTVKDEYAEASRKTLERKYEEARGFYENTLKTFETHIGRQLPSKEEEARVFVQNLYATEGSSLVLARILFVRFLEDHEMTMRKISNGGIKAFRDYHQYIKDDYQFLLTDAYKEAEHLYHRLFEQSVFDWSHRGDGQLSRLLLRIFYRLNAFDFEKISGDILGNLYERFLDIKKRKKLGEYYTPIYVARYVLERIGFYEKPGRLLDPACGSGTFLIAAMEGLIKQLVRRGVKLDLAIKQAVDLVHGLDINVFAAFIAQLQLIWHLLPYLRNANMKQLPDLRVYGGINSLVYRNQKTLFASSYGLPTEAGAETRDLKYRYVVGNPPYIRNERLKDTGPWRANYDLVDFRNSDIAYFFIARAIEGKKDGMPSWLDDGGRMCFVLPMGLCDSDAASAIRQRLLQYKILEVTDLEDVAIRIFPSPQASGRATVAPILLFVERSKAEAEQRTNIVQVREDVATVGRFDPQWLSVSSVPEDLFQVNPINPFGQILTKLRDEDLAILKVLLAHEHLAGFSQHPSPCYGIELRGTRASSEPGPAMIPLGKGQNVHTFYMNPRATKYIDVNAVPNNSIWGFRDLVSRKLAFALSNIALTLQCARFDPTQFALDSAAMLFVPREEYAEFPWDCLLNSSPIRFVQLLTMRAGLVGVGTKIEGERRVAWCHIYPRVLKNLPVAKSLLNGCGKMPSLANELNSLARSIARRWIDVGEALEKCSKKPLSLFGVDFRYWQSDLNEEASFQIEKDCNSSILRAYIEDQSTLLQIQGNPKLLSVLKYLLESRGKKALSARELQDLMVPEDFETVSALIDAARDPDSTDIRQFKECLDEVDRIVSSAYGLDEAQLKYIKNRLSMPPLDVLAPRWPWKSVEMREIQEYETDRFA
jgi:type I restriction-modification system DNA methylase subunit